MATQTMVQENTLALTGMVRQWDRRLRLRQTLLWLPRSLMPGVAVGLLLAILSRLRPWLLPQQIALVTLALVAIGVAIFALAVWLWRRSPLTSARRFDVQFDLGERVSTALELGTGIIRSNEELLERQLADAHAKASAVQVRAHIPLALRGRDWAVLILLAAILALLLILPNPQVDALNAASIQQTAIDDAAEQMRELTQDIAADTSLGAEERQTLLEQLQTAINTLEQPNITPEEAFAAVSDVQSELRDRSDDLNRQSSQNQAALQQAADALRQAGQQEGGTGENGEPLGTMEQVEQSLEQIAGEAPDMNAEERAQASQALHDAMQSLQQTNPEAAQALQEAAQQLEQGGNPQQEIERAQTQMQQQAQQAQQQQQASQNLNNASQQAEQSAEQINQAQQQQNQSGEEQQGEQSQQGEQPSQSEQQEQNGEAQEQNQQGQQSQQGEQSQDGQSQMMQPGSQNSEQSQSLQSQPGQGQQQSQQGDQAQAQSFSAGDSTANQQGSDSSQTVQSQQNGQQPDNNADGQGESEFEAVNVPRRIGDQTNDGSIIELDPDASNSPVQEGDFSENPNGQVTVPYDQVFSDYAGAANRALDSDYVPLGLRDVVRDYFTSLEPRR